MIWNRTSINILILMVISINAIGTFGREPPSKRKDIEFKRTAKRVRFEKDHARFLRFLRTAIAAKRLRSRGKQQRLYFDDEHFGKNKKPHSQLPASLGTVNGQKRIKGHNTDTNSVKSCCPMSNEIIEPKFGRTLGGHLVEFYEGPIKQVFYEITCLPHVINKPCSCLKGQNYKISRCTQLHSYSYALIKAKESPMGFNLTHIRFRSGCSCKLYYDELTPFSKRKKA